MTTTTSVVCAPTGAHAATWRPFYPMAAYMVAMAHGARYGARDAIASWDAMAAELVAMGELAAI